MDQITDPVLPNPTPYPLPPVQIITCDGLSIPLVSIQCQPRYIRPQVDPSGAIWQACVPGNLIGFAADGSCYWNEVGSDKWEKIK